MFSAITIANFFISKSFTSSSNNKELVMTPMKVLKLTYISYCWYLKLFNKRLFNDSIYALEYGAIIYSVHSAFKEYKNNPILKIFLNGETIDDLTIIKFLNKIYDEYNQYSGLDLSSICSQIDSAWYKTWHKSYLPNMIITDEIIKNSKI